MDNKKRTRFKKTVKICSIGGFILSILIIIIMFALNGVKGNDWGYIMFFFPYTILGAIVGAVFGAIISKFE